MEPATRRRVFIAAGVLFACAVIGTLAGVLTKVALDNRKQRQAGAAGAPAQVPAALSSSTAASPAAAAGLAAAANKTSPDAAERAALTAPPAPAEQPDSRAAFYPENQRPQESVFMVLGPDALTVAAQSGALPFAYAGWGPCRTLRAVTNISLDLSAAATGCRGAQCAINLRLALPAPGSCADAIPGPYPTVYLISGFSCMPSFYKTFVDRLATWGYAVIQYDRPLGGLYTPSSETESAYLSQVITWRDYANNTRGSAYAGQFAAGPIGVMGHSMGGGLAAILAGMHPAGVGAAVLLDPVDYTQMSLRVARQFLAEYRQPVLVVTAAVHCLDRSGCVPPQDHVPSAAEEAAWAAQGLCRPGWWCCSWDDGKPGVEAKTAAGIALETDGPSGFVEFAAPGSWLARFGLAGHTSFLEQGSLPLAGINCPAVAPNGEVLPDAATLATAFFAARLRGDPGARDLALAWAAGRPRQHLDLGIKGAAAAQLY